MKDVKSIVSKNLVALRKKKEITQAALAARFSYSDKAVCRWESGETLPDINVLCALAEFYGVTMNDLVDPDFSADDTLSRERYARRYRIWMCLLLASTVWIFATVVFAFTSAQYWLAFVTAVPITCIIIHATMRERLGMVGKIIVSSFLAWSTITVLYLHGLVYLDSNAWYLFIVGAPLQAFVIQYFGVKRYKDKL